MNKFGVLCYTYLLGWKNLDIWYYGYRGSNSLSPEDDLWKEYFTSSKYVKEFVSVYGQPDVIRVHKTFNDRFKARDYEHRFLNRVNAVKSSRWLNRHNSGTKFYTPEIRSKSHCQSISNSKKGFKFSEETRCKMSEARKRFNQTEAGRAHIQKLADSKRGKPPHNKGFPMSKEQKEKISASKRKI